MKIDYQKVSSWLSERWKPPASCPVCKKNSWNLSETAFELRALGRSAGVEASAQAGPMWSGIPEARGMEGPEAGETTIVVPVTCGVCGHVLLFDARRLGVA